MRQCVLCGRPIDPADPYVWHGVRGFERKAPGATRRSGSDIALRLRVDEYAHDSCVSLTRGGINLQQQELV